MKYLEIPKSPVLSGEQAIEALQSYLKELQTENSKELTKKQVETLMKFAKALISAIEEAQTKQASENCVTHKNDRVGQFKKSVVECFHSLSSLSKT